MSGPDEGGLRFHGFTLGLHPVKLDPDECLIRPLGSDWFCVRAGHEGRPCLTEPFDFQAPPAPGACRDMLLRPGETWAQAMDRLTEGEDL
jgi:hypothetical protein